MAQSCGWHFTHPDLDSGTDDIGLAVSATGGVALNTESSGVRQAILLLLTTLPGERVMRPNYGCYLHRLVFSPNDETTAGLAIHYVRHALNLWEPRISVVRIDANRNEDEPTQMDITLEYRMRSTQKQETLMISVDLGE